MAEIELIEMSDPVYQAVDTINANFTAINNELGSHTHDASAIATGVVSPGRLGSGTPSTSTVLRGDGQWASFVSGGNFGIGASSPQAPLHVNSAVTSVGIRLDHNGSPRMTAYPNSQGHGELSLLDNQGVSRITLRSSGDTLILGGNVGIGTPTPGVKLDVNGTVRGTTLQGELSPAWLAQAGAVAGQTLIWNGSQWAPGVAVVTSPFQVRTSSFTAQSNTRYLLNASGITVTLPASPANGDWVEVTGSATGCTIARNGRKIMGLQEDMVVDVNHYAIRLMYVASLDDWRIAA